MPSKWTRLTKTVPSRLRGRTQDATTLVRDYLIQETVDPLRTLGRYVVAGALGSLFVGIGVLMLLIGLLRLLQGETGAFDGNLSWLPYLIVVVVAALVAAATVARIVTGPARRRRPRTAKEAS
jgi:H+/Cl- antiporter ClcA